MPRALLAIIVVGVIIYALVDCFLAPRGNVRVMPKAVWVLLILILPVVGAVLWFIFGRPIMSRPSRAGTSRPRPVAPDDDPEFLRSLDIARRQRQENERLQAKQRELEERERKLNGDDPQDGSNKP